MSDTTRIEEIFTAALLRRSAAERAAFLDEACRDAPELRQAVERLLAAHLKAGDFLERPPSDLMPTDAMVAGPAGGNDIDLTGTTIGPYKLLEQIGEGGMGVVYMADQQAPIRRRVALKIIKPGLDTRQVIARFEAERQALALMDHPNIARVFDAGATESGRPYFVMELVRGVPITEYCDQNQLPLHERLELFLLVCQAVQHAHQKGIIHRDIKPSNVLVTMNDGRAVPKVIDFGVAKATNQQLTEKTLFTNFAQMIGTPLYMSPEQAEMTSLDVDTRTDIYSLGVLLYELLTGTTPFDRERVRAAAYDEVRRIIREEIPQRPSLRISTLGQTRTVVASQRQADPARLSQLVRGDLDWIVMRTLEKDRTRRYDTATGLAADVRRYLQNEPVEAGPPSALYRFTKFSRRNRAAIATVALLLAALLLGTTISTWQAVRATRAEHRADAARMAEIEQRRSEQAARAQAEVARALADKERAAAEYQKRRVEGLLYATEVRRAAENWDAASVYLAWQELDSCALELRGWEHDYLYTLFTAAQVAKKGVPVAFNSDDSQFACWEWGESEDDEDHVTICEVATGRTIATLKNIDGVEYNTPFRFDGQFFRGRVNDNDLVWDIGTGCLVRKEPTAGEGNDKRTGIQGRFARLEGTAIVISSGHPGDPELVISPGAQANVENVRFGVALSPDGKRVASGPWRERIRVWNGLNGEEMFALEGSVDEKLEGRMAGVEDLSFTADGQKIVSALATGILKVWDAGNGHLIWNKSVQGLPTNWRTRMCLSPDGCRVASHDDRGTIYIWDLDSGNEIQVLRGQRTSTSNTAAIISGLRYLRDGRRIFSNASQWPTIWDTERGQTPLSMPNRRTNQPAGASSVVFTRDGNKIVTDTGEKTLVVWNADTGEELRILNEHKDNTCCLAISPDGSLLASGSYDETIKIWDTATWQSLLTLRMPEGSIVNWIEFSADGENLISAIPGGLSAWHTKTGQKIWSKSIEKAGSRVAWSPNGAYVASSSNFRDIQILNAGTGAIVREIKADGGVGALAFNPDGSRLAAAESDGAVQVWDMSEFTLLQTFRGHSLGITCVKFTPDGRRIATGSEDSTIKIWDPETGNDLLTLRDDHGPIMALDFSPDGKKLATANHELGARIWDATRRQTTSAN